MSDPSSEQALHGHQANEQNPSGALARLRKISSGPVTPDDAHLADGEEILQADHLASFAAMADGVAIGFAGCLQSATIMSMAVTVRPWLSEGIFVPLPRSVNAA